MLTVTSREFRAKQASVFELADNGEQIIIRRGKKPAYTLIQINDNDLYFTPEMEAKIKRAEKQIKNGESVTIRSDEELNAFFDSL